MSVPLRARASVPQSLVRVAGKAQAPGAARFSEWLRADAETQKIMATAPIGWVDEVPFIQLLTTAHQRLGDDAYVLAVHDASMLMLKTGIMRAAQSAFLLFKKPGLSAYAKWAQRIWGISFQGLALVYHSDDQGDGIGMVLSNPPASGFTKPLVLGTVGILQTVFTLARLPGQTHALAYRTDDAEVQFRLRAGAKA